MQGGLHAANTIGRRLEGKAALPFRYRDVGSVATIGRFRASPASQAPPQRLPRVARLVLRPPRVPVGLRQPDDDDAPLAAFDGRPRPGRARLQRAHTGGDLSLPASVRAQEVQPTPYPIMDATQATRGRWRKCDSSRCTPYG